MAFGRKESRKRKRLFRKIKLVLLKGGECQKCGYDENITALDFHHRDESKKSFELKFSNMECTWKRLLEEVYKCDLLCANCHRVTHQPQYSLWKQTCKELINKAKDELKREQ